MRTLFLVVFFCMAITGLAQEVGDTITIKTFNYSQTYGINQWSPGIRDSVIDFSTLPNVQFEKVLMTYNMRCKDGKVSNGNNRDRGCGEWDISCNTYFHDSTRTDSVPNKHPNYVISGFTGTNFDYTSKQLYNYYEYTHRDVQVDNINSEDQFNLFSGNTEVSKALNGANQSGKIQVLYTANELTTAGFSTGDIDGIKVNAIDAGKMNFFRVRMKQVTTDSLDIKALDFSKFTPVYFGNYSFVKGENRIQFLKPFNWNGTDNVIVEFCFTNSTPTSQLELEGSSAASGQVVWANNNYSTNMASNGHFDMPASSLSSIANEITVSFWAYGNVDQLPANTTILNGTGANGERDVNIHLPWGNSQVYWDCGGDGDGYDRINKAASPTELEGRWNHWAFTKKVATGEMKIYLNGKLWHSGTDKRKPIDVTKFVVGKSTGYGSNYKGSIDELRVWDKALTETEISDWMNVSVNATHPSFKNLIAYYPLNEGAGTEVQNAQNMQDTAKGNDAISWEFKRGVALDRFFEYSTVKPNISLLRGDYDTSVITTKVLDSLPLAPRSVVKYAIDKKNGFDNDEVRMVSTELLWRARPQQVYQGATTTVLRDIPVSKEGTITVEDLSYFRRWPAKYEIMSFVTPYGINLDLGPNGKTWTFDVTDFLPIFNGKKRMTMEHGGQWMEDMDIRFHFIVGTPVRDVLDMHQIWRPERRGYAAINNNTFFAPRNVPLHPEGKHFAIRSTITGHGQQGEFIPRNHHLSVDGNNRFSWEVWTECAENPVYPQGGTWVYDRAGWCPGAPTDVHVGDITTYVSGKSSTEIDYDVDVAAGASNYFANHQLIAYGPINHALDARLLEVRNPSNRVEFTRFNANCHDPLVVIQNTGSTELTSATINYWINDSQKPLTYEWKGKLGFLETAEVFLPPTGAFWEEATSTNNVFHAEITQANGTADEYAPNNVYHSAFDIPEVLPHQFIIQLRTNQRPQETSFDIEDFDGNKRLTRSGFDANSVYRDTVKLGVGCYTLNVYDADDDGLSWWANNDGNGSIEIREISGRLMKTFNPDFGDNIRYNFTVEYPLSYEKLHPTKGLSLYPNPAQTHVNIQYDGNASQQFLQVLDFKGRVVFQQNMAAENGGFDMTLPIDQLKDGFYMVKVTDGDELHTSKFVKN